MRERLTASDIAALRDVLTRLPDGYVAAPHVLQQWILRLLRTVELLLDEIEALRRAVGEED